MIALHMTSCHGAEVVLEDWGWKGKEEGVGRTVKGRGPQSYRGMAAKEIQNLSSFSSSPCLYAISSS